jgi:hypothetical protein
MAKNTADSTDVDQVSRYSSESSLANGRLEHYYTRTFTSGKLVVPLT